LAASLAGRKRGQSGSEESFPGRHGFRLLRLSGVLDFSRDVRRDLHGLLEVPALKLRQRIDRD
jgi:hypothetical protein